MTDVYFTTPAGEPIPVLPCWQYRPYGSAAVFCTYCARYHFHGLGTGTRGPDGRQCHCGLRSSPHWRTGYILVSAGNAPESIVADIRRQRYIRRFMKRRAVAEFFAVNAAHKVVALAEPMPRPPAPPRDADVGRFR